MSMKYQIGDIVWKAYAGQVEITITCPMCRGHRFITATFGDGESASVACGECQRGYEPSTGYVTTYEFQAKAVPFTITKIDASKLPPEYDYVDEVDCFATEQEALVRAAELAEKHKADEVKRITWLKEHETRTWAWHVFYHRKEAKRHQEQVEYHTAKLNAAKTFAKVTPPA